MAWMRVESSVSRHRKFLKAGPAPSWLWICGLSYCQEGLTNGFIPSEAIDHLGCKNARALSRHLVAAGLWDETPDGWHVHDYLDWNRDAHDIRAIQADRRKAGANGGLRSGASRRAVDKPPPSPPPEQPAKQNTNFASTPDEAKDETVSKQPANPAVRTAIAVAEAVAVAEATAVQQTVREPSEPPMDEWARELVSLYPQKSVCSWNMVEPPLFKILNEAPDPWEAWDALKARLEGHKRSHQWRVKGMIPRLDRYLRDGAHLQELAEHPPGELVSEKTSRTLSSLASIMRGSA